MLLPSVEKKFYGTFEPEIYGVPNGCLKGVQVASLNTVYTEIYSTTISMGCTLSAER